MRNCQDFSIADELLSIPSSHVGEGFRFLWSLGIVLLFSLFPSYCMGSVISIFFFYNLRFIVFKEPSLTSLYIIIDYYRSLIMYRLLVFSSKCNKYTESWDFSECRRWDIWKPEVLLFFICISVITSEPVLIFLLAICSEKSLFNLLSF